MFYLYFAYRSLIKFDNSYLSHDVMEILFEFVEFACISCIFPIRHPSSSYIRSGVRGLLSQAQTNVKKHETRITKQNGLAHPRVIVCAIQKQTNKQKHCFVKRCFGNQTVFDSGKCFHRNMCETKTNVYVSLYRQRCC